MRLTAAFAVIAATAAAAPAAQAAQVEIRDAAARVTVVPEDRSDIKVEVTRPNAQLPLTISASGDHALIDGGLGHRIRGCSGMSRNGRIRIHGVGEVREDDLPQVVIHTPRSVEVQANGAVLGSIGRTSSLELRDSGCSAWTVADVAGEARVRSSGAGQVRMGQASRLDIHLSGAADIRATRVREALDASLSGAGDVRIGEVGGQMDARVSGVGSIRVDAGQDTAVRASVSGVGNVEFGGVASRLDASVSGMGGVRVREVTGTVSKSVSGIGRVSIGD